MSLEIPDAPGLTPRQEIDLTEVERQNLLRHEFDILGIISRLHQKSPVLEDIRQAHLYACQDLEVTPAPSTYSSSAPHTGTT